MTILKQVSCLYCDEENEYEVEDEAMTDFLLDYECPNGCPPAFYISRDGEKYCVECDGFFYPRCHVCFQRNYQEWIDAGEPDFWIPCAWRQEDNEMLHISGRYKELLAEYSKNTDYIEGFEAFLDQWKDELPAFFIKLAKNEIKARKRQNKAIQKEVNKLVNEID